MAVSVEVGFLSMAILILYAVLLYKNIEIVYCIVCPVSAVKCKFGCTKSGRLSCMFVWLESHLTSYLPTAYSPHMSSIAAY